MDLEQCDDSDSGVSADLSLNSMSDSETPIEREIRLAFKREQSLRRSRGLDETKEFIEIPLRKSILSQNLPNKPAKDQSKERQLAGKKMQREILAEAEREKVLVKLGRLPGFYDKGTVRQLHERKRLFEAFQGSKDVHTSSDRSLESMNNMERLLQDHSLSQPTDTSPRTLPISQGQEHVTHRTVQEPKNGDSSCVVSGTDLSGKSPDRSSEEQTRLGSSAQHFPSLKERKMWFESFQEKRETQIFRDKKLEVSGSGLQTKGEDLKMKRSQHDQMSGISKEPVRNLQVQSSKPCGPGFSEAVNQQVIIIENNPITTAHTDGKVPHRAPTLDPAPPPESQSQSWVPNRTVNSEELPENPFFKLRSSLLPEVEEDIRNTRTREEELRQQSSSLYGNRSKVTVTPSRTASTKSLAKETEHNRNISPVSLSFRKLDLIWPPPSLQNGQKTQPKVKEQRQTNLLVQRWEAGLINGHNLLHHN